MSAHTYQEGEKDTRPWGTWEVLAVDDSFIVKKIQVKPGQLLSYQYHNHRAETWVLTKGRGIVTINDEPGAVEAGAIIHIEIGDKHRIENTGPDVLEFVEIQTGDILDENDIIRLEDTYGRLDHTSG